MHKIKVFLLGVTEVSLEKPLSLRSSTLHQWRTHSRYGFWTQESIQRVRTGSNNYSICGPVLAQELEEPRGKIEFRMFSSEIRGVDAKTWELDNLPSYDAFACDYDQDLLVLVQRSVHGSN